MPDYSYKIELSDNGAYVKIFLQFDLEPGLIRNNGHALNIALGDAVKSVKQALTAKD